MLNSCPQSQSYSTLFQLPVLNEVEVGIGGPNIAAVKMCFDRMCYGAVQCLIVRDNV